MKENFITKYFEDRYDYPNNVTEEILPINTLWQYISSTFCNGFINYVTIKKAFLSCRYKSWDQEIDSVSMYDNSKWTKFEGTKNQIYNIAIEKGRIFHFDMSMFEDDVIILGKSKDNQKYWWYFWFDMDVSDCFIGRFETELPENEVIEDFTNYVKNNEAANDLGEVKELPLHMFSGWIKF